MSYNHEIIDSSVNKTASLDSLAEEKDGDFKDSDISKENIPNFLKILILDDGKRGSNKVLNYAISLSKYSGADLVILRILESVENMENISIEALSRENGTMDSNEIKRKVEGDILDELEQKIKKCKEAGCEKNISYKFRTGDVVDQIVNEVKEGNYDLILLKSRNIDSWMKSLFSDARKILGNISTPVLIIQ
ncbi:MAG: universal stress protein [Nitrososphaeraceae archaeon]